MHITSFDGRIKVVKLPAILDPIQNPNALAIAKEAAAVLAAKANTAPDLTTPLVDL